MTWLQLLGSELLQVQRMVASSKALPLPWAKDFGARVPFLVRCGDARPRCVRLKQLQKRCQEHANPDMEGYEELEVLEGFKAYGNQSTAAEESYYTAGPSGNGTLFGMPEPRTPRFEESWANPVPFWYRKGRKWKLLGFKWYMQGCYPCLLANRLCGSRFISANLKRAQACLACRRQGLSIRQCAMPTLSRRGADFNDWAWVPPDLTACHICGKLGPVSQCTRCMRCAVWVCPRASCRRLARASLLNIWICCHCLGVPLECACNQSFSEVGRLLGQLELPALHELPWSLQSPLALPRTAHALRQFRARRRWWQVDGLLKHPFWEATFLDDAATLRKITAWEYNDMQLQIEALRGRMAQAEEPQLLATEWLRQQISFSFKPFGGKDVRLG